MYIIKFFYSVRHTRFSQLITRLNLTAKRKCKERFFHYYNKRFSRIQISCLPNDSFPLPVFSSRTGFFKLNNTIGESFDLTFLNKTYSFQFPIDWHNKELEYGTRLWKLNLHYHEFLEEVDDLYFEKIILDWISQNPPYKKGYWLDSWNSYSLSIRVVVWMQQIAKRKDRLSSEFLEIAFLSLSKQLYFLNNNIENDIRGNHLIKNIKALLWASIFFEKTTQVTNWRTKGEKLLLLELNEQILGDGLHFELSPAYHCQVFADLLECYIVVQDEEIKKILATNLRRMETALNLVTHPDGKVSSFNDGGLNMAYKPIELLKIFQELFRTKIDKFTSIELPKAGYYGLYLKDSFFLYDAGPIAPDYLPAHGHGDIFSFEWSIAGQRFFIDKGVYEYNFGSKRDLSRATISHNTLSIDGEDQCEFWGAFRVARRANVRILEKQISDSGIYIRGTHDGYKRLKGNPIHERAVSFDGGTLLIRDSVKGGRGQKAEARFLLHPGVEISMSEASCVLKLNEVRLNFQSPSPLKIIDSFWFPDFGVEIPCKQIIVLYGDCPIDGVCRISRIIEEDEK